METADILNVIQKRTATLNKVVAIVMPIAVVIGGTFWYFQNIWRPIVLVTSVDYINGTASLIVNGKNIMLYAGSTVNARFGWGVRFNGTGEGYDRIELVKNELTYKTLATKNNLQSP